MRGQNQGPALPFLNGDLVRQSVYSRLAGYEDVNDAERLSQDPAFRLIGSEKVLERGAALTSRLQSFETELLTQAENLAGLAVLNREPLNRPIPARLAAPWTKLGQTGSHWAKTLPREAGWSICELKSERQNGNSGNVLSRTTDVFPDYSFRIEGNIS